MELNPEVSSLFLWKINGIFTFSTCVWYHDWADLYHNYFVSYPSFESFWATFVFSPRFWLAWVVLVNKEYGKDANSRAEKSNCHLAYFSIDFKCFTNKSTSPCLRYALTSTRNVKFGNLETLIKPWCFLCYIGLAWWPCFSLKLGLILVQKVLILSTFSQRTNELENISSFLR